MRTLVVLLAALSAAQGAEILALFTTFSHSHLILVLPLFKELSNGGHNVTVVTLKTTGYQSETYREVIPKIPEKYFEYFETWTKEAFENSDSNQFQGIIEWSIMSRDLHIDLFQTREIKNLFRGSPKFDLIIAEVFGAEPLLGFATYYNAPVLGISTLRNNPWVQAITGAPLPSSFVPFVMMAEVPHDMGLLDRVKNALTTLMFEGVMFIMDYYLSQAYDQNWPDPKPSYRDIKNNVFSIVLMNSHVSIDGPQPLLTNIIEVGGMQVNTKSKSLPADIQKFMDEALEGVVLFSLGSNLNAQDMAPERRQAVVEVLAGIKQKVILKWDHPESITQVPKGKFFVSKWLPQSDLLAHKNLRLFVTHGGLGGLTETIYHGKPAVAVPIFADQQTNANNVVRLGMGVRLDYKNVTKSSFSWAIREVLENPIYTSTASELSRRYRDRPQNSLDTAKFWVEYTLRHKGAPFMKSPAQKLNYLQYYSLDVYGFLISLLLVALYLIKRVLGLLLRLLFRRKSFVSKQKKE